MAFHGVGVPVVSYVSSDEQLIRSGGVRCRNISEAVSGDAIVASTYAFAARAPHHLPSVTTEVYVLPIRSIPPTVSLCAHGCSPMSPPLVGVVHDVANCNLASRFDAAGRTMPRVAVVVIVLVFGSVWTG